MLSHQSFQNVYQDIKGYEEAEDTDDKWRIKAYSDADFAGDKETQIIVTGYVIFL